MGTFGIVFDIDGVILRGAEVIPGAVDALKKVQDLSIPYVFMTNNGMESEAQRGNRLGKSLGMDVPTERMVLCHSALKEEAEEIGEGLVLVTGVTTVDVKELMEGIGFKNVRTTSEYAACHPNVIARPSASVPKDREWADQPVRAVVMLERPDDWYEDLQIICDLLRSTGRVTEIAQDGEQRVKFISCNSDFTFVNAFPQPRFAPGAFVETLEMLFAKMTGGRKLEIIKHGKPHAPTYRSAVAKLGATLSAGHTVTNGDTAFKRIYAIGDNPKSDIRGANMMGKPWCSFLVRTGCFSGKDNDSQDRAHFVADNVLAAVGKILELENH